MRHNPFSFEMKCTLLRRIAFMIIPDAIWLCNFLQQTTAASLSMVASVAMQDVNTCSTIMKKGIPFFYSPNYLQVTFTSFHCHYRFSLFRFGHQRRKAEGGRLNARGRSMLKKSIFKARFKDDAYDQTK